MPQKPWAYSLVLLIVLIGCSTQGVKSDKDIVFHNGKVEILRLGQSGDIFVAGRLAENDKQVVNAMRYFLNEVAKTRKKKLAKQKAKKSRATKKAKKRKWPWK